MTESMDLNLMKLDSDILLALNSYSETLHAYIGQYPLIDFDPSNQHAVEKFYQGLYSLSIGFAAIVEAFREMCYAKDIVVTN
jgi:hypothetical protein